MGIDDLDKGILRDRIKKALDIAVQGSFDGGHHKMWVIDQMVRALTGCPEIERGGVDARGEPYHYTEQGEGPEYLEWVRNFMTGDDGPQTYTWDTGIAP